MNELARLTPLSVEEACAWIVNQNREEPENTALLANYGVAEEDILALYKDAKSKVRELRCAYFLLEGGATGPFTQFGQALTETEEESLEEMCEKLKHYENFVEIGVESVTHGGTTVDFVDEIERLYDDLHNTLLEASQVWFRDAEMYEPIEVDAGDDEYQLSYDRGMTESIGPEEFAMRVANGSIKLDPCTKKQRQKQTQPAED